MSNMPLGLCIPLESGVEGTIKKLKNLGLPTVQLHSPPQAERTPGHAEEMKSAFREAGIDVTLMFCIYTNEDYKTLQAAGETGGLVPKATRAERVEDTKRIADFVAALEVPAIGMHFGVLPDDRNDPD